MSILECGLSFVFCFLVILFCDCCCGWSWFLGISICVFVLLLFIVELFWFSCSVDFGWVFLLFWLVWCSVSPFVIDCSVWFFLILFCMTDCLLVSKFSSEAWLISSSSGLGCPVYTLLTVCPNNLLLLGICWIMLHTLQRRVPVLYSMSPCNFFLVHWRSLYVGVLVHKVG